MAGLGAFGINLCCSSTHLVYERHDYCRLSDGVFERSVGAD